MEITDSVDTIKGIGPKTLNILNKAGIKTIRDLLYYLPRTYENYQNTIAIKDLRPGKVCIRGKIGNLKTSRTSRRNFCITEGTISDGTDVIPVIWFNQPYRAKQFEDDKEYYFRGVYDLNRGRYILSSPQVRLATEVNHLSGADFQPIYKARGSFKSENFRRIFESIRNEFALIPDLLPSDQCAPAFVRQGARAEALFKVHFAENPEDVTSGRQYLAYEELFELILAANLNKQANSKLRAIKLPFCASKTQDLVKKLPFTLTNAQRRATWDILQDLEKDLPMNRLLQGDVGSGKTVVAAIAAHQAVASGHQVALLAPTAILASQHAESLSELLAPFGIKVALLIGSTKNKPSLKQKIKNGEIDLIVGTHALITDDTEFRSLAFCIIDEQHRFGVNQRQKLLIKTADHHTAPHLLAMSATPIPRSLQLAIFGDLEVSTISELPKGRQPITTKILSAIQMTDELYPKVREILAKKQQVYWICRNIESGASTSGNSVKKTTAKLQDLFKNAHVESLHGKMKAEEKDDIMTRFSEGKIDILVSTTVVEVGVNVPNATLMVIMDAENYGLAQVHQLRGRVGRGSAASFCYLVTPDDSQPTQRLRELETSTDGFHLAEVDLKLRGPGEIYGSLQHGALNLNIATLSDTQLIAAASKQAKAFAKTPQDMVKYPELQSCIKKYQQLTTLN